MVESTNPKLTALRHLLTEQGIQAYVVFHNDAHTVSETRVSSFSLSISLTAMRGLSSSRDSVGAMAYVLSLSIKLTCGLMAGTTFKLANSLRPAGRCRRWSLVYPHTSSGSPLTSRLEIRLALILPRSVQVTKCSLYLYSWVQKQIYLLHREEA